MARMRIKVKGRWQWVELSPQAEVAMEAQLRRFREKFGRAPEPDEPVFYDPDFDVPTPYDQAKFHRQFAEVMRAAGTRGELIYAYEQTGFMLTEENRHLFSKCDLHAWRKALWEFRRQHPEGLLPGAILEGCLYAKRAPNVRVQACATVAERAGACPRRRSDLNGIGSCRAR